MKKLFSIIIWLLLVSTSLAAWPWDACCEIKNLKINQDFQGKIFYECGTGTMIGDNGTKCLIISCGHVFKNGGKQALVKFCNGKTKENAQVIGTDFEHDLSMLVADKPAGIESPNRVRMAKPEDGILIAAGYPYYSKGEEHYTQGKYIGYKGNDVFFAAKPFVHSGFSGGPLFSKNGDLVGVVCGYVTDTGSYASSGPALEAFVGKYMKMEKQ